MLEISIGTTINIGYTFQQAMKTKEILGVLTILLVAFASIPFAEGKQLYTKSTGGSGGVSVHLPLADLTITNAYADVFGFRTKDGEYIPASGIVYVTIKNIGHKVANNFDVKLGWLGLIIPGEDDTIEVVKLQKLKPNEEKVVLFHTGVDIDCSMTSICSVGLDLFSAYVDSNSVIRETNEHNNIVSFLRDFPLIPPHRINISIHPPRINISLSKPNDI